MTSFVLIPGAGGEAGYWHLVSAALEAQGHQVESIDLPGPAADAGLAVYVDIAEVAVDRCADPPVLVGQSLGGFTAAWVAHTKSVREIVLLNAMIPAPHETAGAWWEATGHEQARRESDVAAGRDPDAPFDPVTYFLHDVPSGALAGAGEGREEADRVFGDPWAFGAWPDVPTRVLVGRDDRFFPAEFQERVAWQRLGQDVEFIPGGHLAALSQPEVVVHALLGD